jgi:heme exporter protein D
MNHWSNFADFVHMGGYGLYVWGSLGMCAAVMLAEMLMLKARRRALANDVHGAPANDATTSDVYRSTP